MKALPSDATDSALPIQICDQEQDASVFTPPPPKKKKKRRKKKGSTFDPTELTARVETTNIGEGDSSAPAFASASETQLTLIWSLIRNKNVFKCHALGGDLWRPPSHINKIVMLIILSQLILLCDMSNIMVLACHVNG